MLLDRLRAPKPRAVRKLCLAVTAIWPLASAIAQTTAPGAPAASASAAGLTPAERAKRDGDQVFHWILIHSDKPRKPVATKDDKAPVAVARVKPPVHTTAHGDEPTTATSAGAAPGAAAPATATATAPTAATPTATAITPEPPALPATASRAPVAAAPAQTPAASDAGVAGVPAKADSVVATAPASTAATAVAAAHDNESELLTPLSQAEPKFPANLVRTLRSGQVQVKFTVLPDGSVAEPTVVASSNQRLNPAALAAVAQWRFAPLRKPQHGVVDLGFNNDAE